MGFLDKVKEKAQKVVEGTKQRAEVLGRYNSKEHIGYADHHVKSGDFADSFFNIEKTSNGTQGIIYNYGKEDYCFTADDIVSCKPEGRGDDCICADGNQSRTCRTERYNVEFKDGKKVKLDVFADAFNDKSDKFSAFVRK